MPKYCLVYKDENSIVKDVEEYETQEEAEYEYAKMKSYYSKYKTAPWDLFVYRVTELLTGKQIFDLVCSTKPESVSI